MELISQRVKAIMEECKNRAREAGLLFDDESLEYIVTNRDLIELSPKGMIPTMYDYWLDQIEVIRNRRIYEIYPSNPYETVINTRPAISFYNDNNPDWLNVMIFYHVLAHIDFFQNNRFFRNTWDYDFTGKALSDKRLINRLRSVKGRWVDYVIEFARGVDNITGYFRELTAIEKPSKTISERRLDYYFDIYLQQVKELSISEYQKILEEYNKLVKDNGDSGDEIFFEKVKKSNPDFESLCENFLKAEIKPSKDLMEFIINNSEFLKKEENSWMSSVMRIVRDTSLFFQPQIRTKIMNEGWASFWHETLFMKDDRIKGHEADFAKVNAMVTSLPRVGLNPYALGMRLFYYIYDKAEKGQYTFDFERTRDSFERKQYDMKTGKGMEYIHYVRRHYCDSMFIRDYIDQDFTDKHNLFVTGQRIDQEKMVRQYYVKSRSAEEYKAMVEDTLYHPPDMSFSSGEDGVLKIDHFFEGKPLVKEYLANTMMGIEYLWGAPVELITTEVIVRRRRRTGSQEASGGDLEYQKVMYRMENRKLIRKRL